MENERLHAVVHGGVQGVFFRANTQKQASKLGLKGWVRNNPGGTVEVVAEGSKESLKRLLEWCSKGPSLASVEKVDAKWEKATGEFDAFSIRY